MPKEQIINDEVDVSKCRFYKEGLCCLSYAFVENGYDCVECSEYNDCDYKQLQRKTAECDRYEQALNEIEKELKECVYCESQECACDDFEECLKCTKKYILDIITKAKDGE